MAQPNSKSSGPLKAGLGLAALAAAAAGAYYFYGKNGPQHRKQLKGWTVKARGEVMDKMEQVSDMTKKTYEGIVDEVIRKYREVKKVSPKELSELARDLKGHWNAIATTLKKAGTNKSKK